jgi:hypothetical protein
MIRAGEQQQQQEQPSLQQQPRQSRDEDVSVRVIFLNRTGSRRGSCGEKSCLKHRMVRWWLKRTDQEMDGCSNGAGEKSK